MTTQWTHRLTLAIDDFLVELAEALREAIDHDHRRGYFAPPPKKKRTRTEAQRHVARLTRQRERAWVVLERLGGTPGKPVPVHSEAAARELIRTARARTHPDATGRKSSRDFLRTQRAAALLGAHYGVKL